MAVSRRRAIVCLSVAVGHCPPTSKAWNEEERTKEAEDTERRQMDGAS